MSAVSIKAGLDAEVTDDGTLMHKRLFLSIFLWASPAIAAPSAAIVVDVGTSQILHAEAADTRLHPAGLTQLMTLLLAFDARSAGAFVEGARIEISHNAATQPIPVLGLPEGTQVLSDDILTAVAMAKRNDAAVALAEAVGGSVGNFVNYMNNRALSLCMTRTQLFDPLGRAGPLHMSTAHDLALLGIEVLRRHPEIYTLTMKDKAITDNFDLLGAHARLAGKIKDASGVFTGYSLLAGFVALVVAERQQRKFVVVLLGEPSKARMPKRIEELLDLALMGSPPPLRYLRHCTIS